MCTVSYIPLKAGALFSSSRDENPRRKPAISPKPFRGNEQTLFFPADGAAGGSWIGLNSDGNLVIVLNGGFINHVKKSQYRKSRGIIMTELLDSRNIIKAWQQIDLSDIEPFTIIAYVEHTLHQLVWSGTEKSHMLPDATAPHIWSSSTLYDSKATAQRRQWFQSFVHTHKTPSASELLQYFLHDAPDDYYNGFNMNRNELVKTCSISVVEIHKHAARFLYHDVILSETNEAQFSFARFTAAANL